MLSKPGTKLSFCLSKKSKTLPIADDIGYVELSCVWPQLSEWPHLHPDEWIGKY